MGDLEATAFAFDHIVDRDADVRESAFSFTPGRMKAAEGAKRPVNGEARGVGRDQDGGVLGVTVVFGV